MASDATESFDFYKLWAWFETNRKQVTVGAITVVVGGLVAWYVIWQQQVTRTAADEALSDIVLAPTTTGQHPSADAYLRLANKYPNTSAGGRAVLMAAASLFTDGKYQEALAQFEKFRHEYHDSPLLGEALLGVATCLDAEGKANEAVDAYQDLIRHHPGEWVVPQAKLALAQVYLRQQKPDAAAGLLADVARDEGAGALMSVAALQLENLRMNVPTPVAPPKFTIEKK